jgi:hypothetical protein
MLHRYGTMTIYPLLWWGAVKGRDHMENHVVNGRLVFTFILKEQDWTVWTALTGLRTGTWQADVNSVMNSQFLENARIFPD